MSIKAVLLAFQSLVPVFAATIGGLYLFQAMNTPKVGFTHRECRVIGLAMIAVAAFLALNNRFQWFR